MTNQNIEAQNAEDDYQYLQLKQKRFVDRLLLGFQTALALSPLLITGSVWLYTRYVVSVMGHIPQPMFCQGCTLRSRYDWLVYLSLLICLASAVVWLISFIVLVWRKAGKCVLYPIAVYFAAWTLDSFLWTPEMDQLFEWWID